MYIAKHEKKIARTSKLYALQGAIAMKCLA